MDYSFNFSVLMSVYNVEKYLSEAIESLINQTIGFEENIELIIVDDGSSDNSKEIALKYQEKYPDNIQVISKPNGGQPTVFNLGIKHLHGKYVNFLDSDDILSPNAFEEVYAFFEEHYDEVDLVSIPLMYFGRKTGDHYLNYKYKSTRVIDLVEEPNNPQLSISSAFIKNEALDGLEFNTRIPHGHDAEVVNKILLNKKKLGVVNTATYYYRKRDSIASITDNASHKEEFYTPLLKYLYLSLIDYTLEKEGTVPKFIQYMIIYNIQWYYDTTDFPEFFSENQIEEFWECLYKILSYIDEDVINDRIVIRKIYVRTFLMYIKNHKDFYIDVDRSSSVVDCGLDVDGSGSVVDCGHDLDESDSPKSSQADVILKTGDFILNDMNKHNIYFYDIRIQDGFLRIYGSFTSSCNYDTLSIEATQTFEDGSKETFKAEKDLEKSHIRRIFGIDWHYRYHFKFKMPLVEKDSIFTFNLIYEEDSNRVVMNNHIRFKDDALWFKHIDHMVNENYILIACDDSFKVTPFTYEKYNEIREELYTHIQDLINTNKALTRQNKRLENRNENLKNRNEKLKENLAKSRAKNKEIVNSTSWKITEPLRKSKHLLNHKDKS